MCLLFLIFAIVAGIICYYFNQWYRRDFLEDFHNKRVFITGTDSGFGKRLAIDLDRRGVVVYAGCYTENGAKELAKVTSKRLKLVRIDVTDVTSITEAKMFIEKDIPANEGLWGLVNNAGIFHGLCFDFCTMDDYRKSMEVNFFGPVRVTEAFLPLVKKARGRIVTVISGLGRGNVLPLIPYSCSKYALEPYCDALRRSMKTFGVHSAILEPGFFPGTALTTPEGLTAQKENSWANLSEESKREYGVKFKENTFQRLMSTLEHWPCAKQNGANLNFVTDAMQHALGAKHPKARYPCGSDVRPHTFLTNVLPDWILDFVARYIASYRDVAAKV